jgi:hypothetical protein
MSILNYFFIGFAFTFLIELLFNKFVNHPLLSKESWGFLERLICIIIWPLAVLVFLISFIKQFFK